MDSLRATTLKILICVASLHVTIESVFMFHMVLP